MFEAIARVPGDAILGLIQQFNEDPNPDKVDLGVGVYRDEAGITPVMRAVKVAEQQLVETEQTKSYIGSHGDPGYGALILKTVFGSDSKLLAAGRASATQSPGGTGALRLAADFLARHAPGKTIWLPTPTWPNHLGIFQSAGIAIQRYAYVDERNAFDFAGMLAALQSIPESDIVLLHACCHNPTGYDPDRAQWQQILDVVRTRKLLPLVDFAYQGLGEGMEEDAYSVRLLADNLDELLVTQSCSKNFGLYRERIGTFIAVAANAEQAANVRSQLAVTARENYSNPPAHGSAVVTTILESDTLTTQWREELEHMRERIANLRVRMVDGFKPYGLETQFAFIAQQRGMFSYTGLNKAQTQRLKDEFSIYMTSDGRANICGLTEANIPYVCKAIAAVVAG